MPPCAAIERAATSAAAIPIAAEMQRSIFGRRNTTEGYLTTRANRTAATGVREEPVGLTFTYALLTQKAMNARREAQRISGISASRATKQTRFLGATRRDEALWAHV